MADITGTKRMQDQDRQAVNAGRAKRTISAIGQGAKKGLGYVPFTPQRRAKLRESDAKIMGQALGDALGDKMGGPKQQEPGAGQDIGHTPIGKGVGSEGDYSEVTAELMKAIRSGQSRDGSDAGMLMWEVVTQEPFIQVIEKGVILTPREQMGDAYKKKMRAIRGELARDLRKKTVKDLDADMLDIIYCTLVGQMHVFDDNNNPMYHTDGKGRPLLDDNGQKVSVLFWETENGWVEGVPLPNDAFFRLVESVALREHAGNEGQFLGNVLKAMSTTRTVHGESQEETLKYLVDENYIDDYLERRTAKPIERAVAHFQAYVRALLVLPESEMHPELKLAGTGYFIELKDGSCIRNDEDVIRAFQHKIAEVKLAQQAVLSAQAELDTATGEHKGAQEKTEAAREVLKNVTEHAGSVEDKYRQVLQLKDDVKAGKKKLSQSQVEAALKATEQEVEAARANVKAAQEQLAKAEGTERGLLSRLQDAEEKVTSKKASHIRAEESLNVMKETEAAEYLSLVKTLTDNFRSELLGQMSGGDIKTTISSKTERWVENLSIVNLVKEAKELLDVMDESLRLVPLEHQSHWLEMSDDELKQAFKNDKLSVEKLEAIYELRRLKKETHETFKYKMEEFGAKVNEFKQNVNKAKLHPDLRMRLMLLATAIEGRRQARPELEQIIEEMRTMHGYPLGEAAKASLDKLQKRTKANVGQILDGEFISARMIFENQGKPESPPAPAESRWKKRLDAVLWHLFTKESWIGLSKDDPNRKPGEPRGGKLTKLYRWTWGQTVDDLMPWNFWDKVVFREPKRGKPREHKYYRRGFRGIWKGVLKTMFWGGLVVAISTAPPNPERENWKWYSYLWPVNLAQHVWHHGITNAGHYWDHFYRPPWQWWSAHSDSAPRRRIISDTYLNPDRLTDRPLEYYAQAFGVRDEDNQRWLRRHEGVLRYFQERRTLKRVLSVTQLPASNSNCSQVKSRSGSTEKGRTKAAATKAPEESEAKAPAKAREDRGISLSLIGGDREAEARRDRLVAKVRREYGREIPEDEILRLEREYGEKIPEQALNRLKFQHMKMDQWAKLALERGQSIPNSCKALGIESLEDVMDYQPLKLQDRWQRGNPFCCTVAVEYENISDGQMLNRAKADEFVSYLRGQEDHGTDVTLTYLEANRDQWLRMGFHISRTQDSVMEKLGISNLERVDFVLAQGTTKVLDSKTNKMVPVRRVERALLEPLLQYAKAPESQPAEGAAAEKAATVEKAERIVPQHREAFLAEWEGQVAGVAKSSEGQFKGRTIDPRRVKVDDGILEEAFNAALATGRSKGWVENYTEAFMRQKLVEALPEGRLSQEQAYVLLAPKNKSVRDLLLKIQSEPSGRYRINPEMLNQVIMEMTGYKNDGGDVGEYDPYAEPMGERATYAIENRWFLTKGAQAAPAPGKGSPASAEPEAALQVTGTKFQSILDGTIQRIFADEGEDGRAAKAAFGGDRAAAERALRAEMDRVLVAKGTSGARRRSNYGLSATQGEGGVTVEVTSVGTARRAIRNHLVEFLRSQGSQ